MSQEMKQLMDKLDQTLIAVRDSASPSLSKVILEMTKKLDEHIITHEKDVKAINAKLDPVADAFSKVTGFRSVILTVSTLMLSTWGIIEAWKRFTGK
jgi:hypothetical protein